LKVTPVLFSRHPFGEISLVFSRQSDLFVNNRIKQVTRKLPINN